MVKKRINWIDVAKFFGIFMIFLGHFNVSAGASYPFVFKFHVPLFFFLSGCTENFNKETSILKNIKKNIKNILIPTYFFAIVSLMIYTISANIKYNQVIKEISIIAKGLIRNTYFASALWFLTCLFVMKIIFIFVRKLKFKTLMITIGISCLLISLYVIPTKPSLVPNWYWNYYNFDWFLCYFHYFIIGYVLFPYLQKLLESKNKIANIIINIISLLVISYAALFYFDINLLIKISFLNPHITSITNSYILIMFIIFISYYLKDISLFNDIGKNTLYLCGSEYIIKSLLATIIGIFGLNLTLNNPFATYIYTFILIIISNNYLTPLEKNILDKITLKKEKNKVKI